MTRTSGARARPRKWVNPLAAIVAACVTLAALCATPAFASHNQTVFFEAGQDLLNPATRPRAFTQMQELGVKAIRVELSWANVAPGATDAVRPSFDATDPASYDWGEYDPILDEAQRLKWQVLLTVTSPVPRWATANGTAPYLTRPDNLEFQEFMTAVARQFGSQPKVLIGETAPFGESSIDARKLGVEQDVSPLAFLRGMLCLNADYHKSATCSELHPDGYSHHPYTLPAGPFYRPPNQDDVTIGTLARLTGALTRAASAGALPPRLPIYLTEFGFNTKPSQIGVSRAQQAQFDAVSEHIAWENPDVAAFSQYQLQDDPVPASRHKGFTGFQTGLESALGAPKPLFYSFPVPLTVTRVGRGYSLWGLVRPADGSTELTVLVRAPAGKRYRTLRTVRTNSLGYWSIHSTTPGVDWRVRWISPAGRTYEGPPIAAYR
jgi:hypothetical protein